MRLCEGSSLRLGLRFAFRVHFQTQGRCRGEFNYWSMRLGLKYVEILCLGLRLRSPFKTQGCLHRRLGLNFAFRVAFRRLKFAFRVAFSVPLQNPGMFAVKVQICG